MIHLFSELNLGKSAQEPDKVRFIFTLLEAPPPSLPRHLGAARLPAVPHCGTQRAPASGTHRALAPQDLGCPDPRPLELNRRLPSPGARYTFVPLCCCPQEQDPGASFPYTLTGKKLVPSSSLPPAHPLLRCTLRSLAWGRSSPAATGSAPSLTAPSAGVRLAARREQAAAGSAASYQLPGVGPRTDLKRTVIGVGTALRRSPQPLVHYFDGWRHGGPAALIAAVVRTDPGCPQTGSHGTVLSSGHFWSGSRVPDGSPLCTCASAACLGPRSSPGAAPWTAGDPPSHPPHSTPYRVCGSDVRVAAALTPRSLSLRQQGLAALAPARPPPPTPCLSPNPAALPRGGPLACRV